MRKGFVKSVAALLVGTGCAMAQAPGSGTMKTMPRGGPAVTPHEAVPSVMPSGPVYGHLADEGCATCATGSNVSWDCYDQPYTFWASGEYLLWNIRNASLPPLGTNVPVGLLQVPQTDLFTGPGGTGPVTSTFSVPISLVTNPVVPDSLSLDLGEHSGGRFTVGAWLDSTMDVGVEASFFFLEQRSEAFRATTINTVNQFNLQTGVEDRTFFVPAGGGAAQLVASTMTVFPAQANSDLFGVVTTDLWGAEANVRCVSASFGAVRFGGLIGARYLNFSESLGVLNTVTLIDAPQFGAPPATSPLPITVSTADTISTRNQIAAAQIGVDMEINAWGFFLGGRAKVGVGPNFQEIDVFGTITTAGVASPVTSAPGGLLSGPSNQGEQGRTRVAFVPELNAKLGYAFGQALRAYVAYDWLYMQHVLRPGQQTSFNTLNTQVTVNNGDPINVNLLQPAVNLKDLDVWVQGVSFGVELRY